MPEALAAAGPVLPQPQTRFPTRRHTSQPETRLQDETPPPLLSLVSLALSWSRSFVSLGCYNDQN